MWLIRPAECEIDDPYNRFDDYGVPPDKNGDFAYLLHIIRSLKSQGKGACILPHGVLFRGNAEADIREALIEKGYIKGIIALPANLFYGTGIPACIIVIDKAGAVARRGIFMVDAGKGFIKDGNKNRLREMDIHKIVDIFNKQVIIEGYSKMVTFADIEKNNFNLNIPRYIDNAEVEDVQDIEAHLLGGVPKGDVDALSEYWQVCPNLNSALFQPAKRSANYLNLQVANSDIKDTIYQHTEYAAFITQMNQVFEDWRATTQTHLKQLQQGFHPKEIIHTISEALLQAYTDKPLISKYDVYQHLLNYWFEVMQDDCYLIAADSWTAPTYRIIEEKKNKDGKVIKSLDKGWTCDLIPKPFVIKRYFAAEQLAIDTLTTELENQQNQKTELEEEHSGEGGAFSELEKINRPNITIRLKELKGDPDAAAEIEILNTYIDLLTEETNLKKQIKTAENKLDENLLAFYPTLDEQQIKQLVVDDKWLAQLDRDIHSEMDRISQGLTSRIKELAERYDMPLPEHNQAVADLESAVNVHLQKMGFVWN